MNVCARLLPPLLVLLVTCFIAQIHAQTLAPEFQNGTRSVVTSDSIKDILTALAKQPVWLQLNATDDILEQHNLAIKINFVQDTNLLYIPSYADFFTLRKISQKFEFGNMDLDDDVAFAYVRNITQTYDNGGDWQFVHTIFLTELVNNLLLTVCFYLIEILFLIF